jgi:two-component system chemotaxis response regulator CheB
MRGHDIIVIGASAGGLEVFTKLAAVLPPDLPASVFIAWHISPNAMGMLPDILSRAGPLPASNARDGEEIRPGHIHIATPDHHLLLEPGKMRVTHGPRENGFRPAVDPLFRSAALAYGPRVVGVILTGGLDDGTAGLWAVKVRNGVTVVQDPREAYAPSMPRNAMTHVTVDHCVRSDELGPLLARLAREPAGEGVASAAPDALGIEARIAMNGNALDAGVMRLGELSPFACPECHGVLIRLKASKPPRFRCHTGHAYTVNSLLAELTGTVEESLWSAFRSVEESVLLMRHMADHAREAGDAALADALSRKAAEAQRRGEWVRNAALQHENISEEKLTGQNPSQ